MEYEWHNAKNEENLRKHGLDLDFAIGVFDDPSVLEHDDDYPEEDCINAVGMVDGQLLHVTFTMRDDVCHMISARGAERHERRWCREGQT